MRVSTTVLGLVGALAGSAAAVTGYQHTASIDDVAPQPRAGVPAVGPDGYGSFPPCAVPGCWPGPPGSDVPPVEAGCDPPDGPDGPVWLGVPVPGSFVWDVVVVYVG